MEGEPMSLLALKIIIGGVFFVVTAISALLVWATKVGYIRWEDDHYGFAQWPDERWYAEQEAKKARERREE